MIRPLATLVLAAVILCPRASSATATADPGLEARLDGLFLGLMQTHHIPGAVLVVFRAGEVVVSKGYGLADVETGERVDADTTRFRVASNSKLLVATAVMQQVERGTLDLDTDVNEYLADFEIEQGGEAFGGPVTLRHLLTHTPGFDDRFLSTAQRLEDPPELLADYLARNMPPRVMPVGRTISYSNHGYALAGHLIERASGLAFAEYIEREILQPLGMTRSSFGVPSPLPEGMARPYVWRNGRHVEIGYDRLLDAPAGDFVTTGSDMARFLLAHLHGGRFGQVQLLKPESVEEMHRPQVATVATASGLAGWTLGFSQQLIDGRDLRTHGGSWRGFGTDATLDPATGDGWFVSTNHDFHGPFFSALRQGLAQLVLGVQPIESPASPPEFAERAQDYVGSYVANRRVRSTALKLGELLFEYRVGFDDETRDLIVAPVQGGAALRLAETGPDRFAERRGFRRAAFLRDSEGEVVQLVIDNGSLDRLPTWRSATHHALVGIGCLVLFASTVAGWLVAGLMRVVAGGARSPLRLRARLLAGAVAVLLSTVLVNLAISASEPDIWELMIELPASYTLCLWLPWVALPMALLLPAQLWNGFESDRGSRPNAPLARLHYMLLILASGLVLAGAWFWNLVPWKG